MKCNEIFHLQSNSFKGLFIKDVKIIGFVFDFDEAKTNIIWKTLVAL